MFKVMIRIGEVWVTATPGMTRVNARRLARFYRAGHVSPNVTNVKVVKA